MIANITEVEASRPEFVPWRGHASSEMQEHTGRRESTASELRWYDPAVVPGLLQTRDYAREILTVSLGAVGDDDDVEAALAERRARQQRWRVSTVGAQFLIAEQALYTSVGDAGTMSAQLEMLLRPLPDTARLGVLPRTSYFHTAATNFVIFGASEVVVETVTGSLRLPGETDIADYMAVFDELAAHAAYGTSADALIRQAITAL